MEIGTIGDRSRVEELKQKLNGRQSLLLFETADEALRLLPRQSVLLDLSLDDNPGRMLLYANAEEITVIGCAVKKSLKSITGNLTVSCRLFGMNLIPGFINRDVAEVSLLQATDTTFLEALMKRLEWPYEVVADGAGMVSPRVLFMIINEAFHVLQQGLASREDIDLAMKLGTNYPFGPFDWCDRIGIRDVYETLLAIQVETGEPRYVISELMKEKYLHWMKLQAGFSGD